MRNWAASAALVSLSLLLTSEVAAARSEAITREVALTPPLSAIGCFSNSNPATSINNEPCLGEVATAQIRIAGERCQLLIVTDARRRIPFIVAGDGRTSASSQRRGAARRKTWCPRGRGSGAPGAQGAPPRRRRWRQWLAQRRRRGGGFAQGRNGRVKATRSGTVASLPSSLRK